MIHNKYRVDCKNIVVCQTTHLSHQATRFVSKLAISDEDGLDQKTFTNLACEL